MSKKNTPKSIKYRGQTYQRVANRDPQKDPIYLKLQEHLEQFRDMLLSGLDLYSDTMALSEELSDKYGWELVEYILDDLNAGFRRAVLDSGLPGIEKDDD